MASVNEPGEGVNSRVGGAEDITRKLIRAAKVSFSSTSEKIT